MSRPVGGLRIRKDRPGRGGQGGSTKLNGNIKGDMHEVPAYPLREERGRLGVEGVEARGGSPDKDKEG